MMGTWCLRSINSRDFFFFDFLTSCSITFPHVKLCFAAERRAVGLSEDPEPIPEIRALRTHQYLETFFNLHERLYRL